jgi:hypothetical protein
MRAARLAVPFVLAAFLSSVACSKESEAPPADKPGASGAGTPSAPPSGPPQPALPPMTQADLETYVNVSLDRSKAPMTPEGQNAVYEKHKTTQDKWMEMWNRVKAAETAIHLNESQNRPIPTQPPHLAGDVEMLRKNKELMKGAKTGRR